MICASGLCVELFLTHLRWLFLDSIWHHRLWRPGLIQFILTHIELQIEMTIESFKSMGTANVSAQYYLFLDVSSKLHVLFFSFLFFFYFKENKDKITVNYYHLYAYHKFRPRPKQIQTLCFKKCFRNGKMRYISLHV